MYDAKPITKKSGLTLIQCLAWGCGGMADNFLCWTVAYLAMPIYNIALGVDPVIIGWAIALPRILDGFLNLLAGHWSDNFRSRWGRRRPFILVAGGISALFFMAAWFPPLHSSTTVATYFFIGTTVLYLCAYGFFSIPYYALGVELTTDYHERTRVQSWRFFFLAASQLLMPWFYKIAIGIGTTWPVEGVKPELVGVRYVGGTAAAVTLLIVILIFVFCRESARVQSQPSVALMDAFKGTLQNSTFVRLTAVNLIAMFGFFVVSPMGLYLGIYYVCDGSKDFAATIGGFVGTIIGVMNLLALVPLTALSRRFGKKAVIIGGQAVALTGFLSTWVMMTPEHPYWGIIPWLFIAPGQLAMWVISSSIGADIVDIDELETGLRREGIYSAVSALLNKGGTGLSSMVSGYVIAGSGFITAVVPSAEVLFRMRALYVLVPAIFTAIAILIAATLPVSTRRMHQVREILDKRHAEASRLAEETQAV